MEKLSKRYQIARLIARRIAEGEDAEKDRELEAWLAESEAHRQEYEDICRRLRQDLLKTDGPDLSAVWKEVERRLPGRKRRLRAWHIAAAACIVAALGISMLQWFRTEPEAPVTVAENSKAYKAKLILGNGKEINLADSSHYLIAEEAGTSISSAGNAVRYESKGAANETVQTNTIIIPRGGEFRLELADGTQVWLNSESKLTYPVQFTGKTREVEMEGEVCFDVAKNAEQPFIVRTGDASIKVLGTLFNVEAYVDNGRITTTLVEGKVEIQSGNERQELLPDRQAVITEKGIQVKEVHARDYISWLSGEFNFTETSLEEIMQKLSRWYNFEFFFANQEVKEAHFSLKIKRYENVADILKKIEKTGRAHFNINGRTIIVSE